MTPVRRDGGPILASDDRLNSALNRSIGRDGISGVDARRLAVRTGWIPSVGLDEGLRERLPRRTWSMFGRRDADEQSPGSSYHTGRLVVWEWLVARLTRP
jgi:hypothetical protein